MPVELKQGKIIDDRFEIVCELGNGGEGIVWYGHDRKLNREIAIKLLKRQGVNWFSSNEDLVVEEARKVAGLNHPNIVAIYDVPMVEGDRLIVMEYLEGGSLEERLKKLCKQGKWISQPEAFRIIEEVLKGLQAAHSSSQGTIIHRDLKPANILFDHAGRAKLADFGFASIGVIDKVATFDKFGLHPEGTPCYMSPEQLNLDRIDHRSDLFNVGLIAYLLFSSAHPFVDHRLLFDYKEMVLQPYCQLPLIKEMMQQPCRSLAGIVAEHLPTELEVFVLKLLALDPANRFQTASEAFAELEDAKNRYQKLVLDHALKLHDFLKTGLGNSIFLTANELALGISLCKRSGFYRQGAYLYDKAGVDFSELSGEAEEGLENDYKVCVNHAGREVEVT